MELKKVQRHSRDFALPWDLSYGWLCGGRFSFIIPSFDFRSRHFPFV